jgi:hypothetical protein
MAPKAKTQTPAQAPKARMESDEESPDIIPGRTLTTEEAKQDYQKQLTLLAEQEAEFNSLKLGGSLSENETIVEKENV